MTEPTRQQAGLDAKVRELIAKWRKLAFACSNHEGSHRGNCRCYELYDSHADELEAALAQGKVEGPEDGNLKRHKDHKP